MAKKCQHIVLALYLMHVITKSQRIYPYGNIIESMDNIIL